MNRRKNSQKHHERNQSGSQNVIYKFYRILNYSISHNSMKLKSRSLCMKSKTIARFNESLKPASFRLCLAGIFMRRMVYHLIFVYFALNIFLCFPSTCNTSIVDMRIQENICMARDDHIIQVHAKHIDAHTRETIPIRMPISMK